MMNDETIVEILRGSRETASKLIAILEVENGYHPVSTVQIAKYQLLVSEIGDAIRYLEKDRSVVCDACNCDLTPENCGAAYCKTCAEAAEHYDKIN